MSFHDEVAIVILAAHGLIMTLVSFIYCWKTAFGEIKEWGLDVADWEIVFLFLLIAALTGTSTWLLGYYVVTRIMSWVV